MEVRILAETKPGEIIYIKSWFSSAGGLDPHTLKVGYHYRYAGGNMLEPLPMGKNT
jgi:predicted aconitase with swiveling domain